jgi:transaldolase
MTISLDRLSRLKVKIFADGANVSEILELCRNPIIQGFTTNPTLMKKAGVTDYEAFAKYILPRIGNLPISFEVFAEEAREMFDQAKKIALWGGNVYVKVPVMNSQGKTLFPLIQSLSKSGVKVNVTAVMTNSQVEQACDALADGAPGYISIFAGRIADTGYDPTIIVKQAVWLSTGYPNVELIWASPRELLNVFQANDLGCHIITVTSDILKKLSLVGKDLTEYSLETAQMFFRDGAGYTL